MSKRGKKYQAAVGQINKESTLPVDEVLKKIKSLSYAKFDESVDVAINLSIDPSKGEQTVRGSVVLPHGTGKKVRVIVFAKGDYAEKAQQAGADTVGADDLIKKIEDGWLDFDYAVATPDLMGKVGKLAKILGPRGLLPNKKVGTVTFDVGAIVSDLKKGLSFFRNDKQGILHFSIGKVSFETSQLLDNLKVLTQALLSAKPPTVKGKYLKTIFLSSTMGVGIPVNPDELVRSL